MLTKYAEHQVLDAWTGSSAERATLGRLAHRHVFSYKPRPGYIYVRSRAISSRCNDNYDEFPATEIKQAYRSFIGKPVFVNHHNADHRRARGVIIDAALHEDTNPDGSADTWAEVLMEVDAVKFPRLAEAVLKGDIARTSMGTDVAYSVCTACGNKAASPVDYCQHIPRMKGMKIQRTTASGTKETVLIAERCYGLRFFENSLLVEDPADPTAFVLGVEDGNKVTAAQIEDEATQVVAQAEQIAVEAAAGTNAQVHKIAGNMRIRQEDLEHNPMDLRAVATERLRQSLAYGEVKAPSKVDTLRAESCPVCGNDDGFSADRCQVCGYMEPPDQFKDPDLTKAKEMDLRQDQQNGSMAPGADGLAPDPNADPNADPSVGQAQPGDLECTNCGEVFHAEGVDQAATDPQDPEAVTDPDTDPDPDPDTDPDDPDDDLDDLVDKSDAELGLDDEDDDDQDDEDESDPDDDDEQDEQDDDEEPEDPTAADPATGEGRITSEPGQPDDLADLDDVHPNQTCPICGQGTLVPVADEADDDQPDTSTTHTSPTDADPARPLQ